MGKLLRFEFAKLIKAKVFYICLLVCAVLTVLATFMTEKDFISSTGYIRMYGSASMLTTILAIAVCSFVCEDAQCCAEKTVLGRGVSRTKFFFAKYISSLTATLLFTLVVIGITAIAGTIRYNYAEDSTLVPALLLSLLGILMFHGFFFGLSTITGKNGIAISMAILIPMILQILTTVMDYFFKIDGFTFDIFSLTDTFNGLSSYKEMNTDMIRSIVMAAAIPTFMIGLSHEIYVRKEN